MTVAIHTLWDKLKVLNEEAGENVNAEDKDYEEDPAIEDMLLRTC